MLHELAQDLRYGVRSLSKARSFSAVAILTLALGIGANSAIFCFLDGVMLKPLPYRDADRIMLVWEKPPGGGNKVVSAMNYLDWRTQNTVFETMVASNGGSMTLSGRGDPTLMRVGRVSAGYFDVYGIKPAIGRTFEAGEDEPGKDRVVVLNHQLWQTQFGGDRTIIGQKMVLDDECWPTTTSAYRTTETPHPLFESG